MMVNEAGGVQGPSPIQSYKKTGKAVQQQEVQKPQRKDAAEISSHSVMMAKLKQTPEVRQEKIDSIKAQIDAGTYDTDDRLKGAVDKLFGEISE